MKAFAAVILFVTVALVGVLTASLVAGRPDRPTETPELGTLANPNRTFDPVREGEPLPAGFRQILGRDGIRPVYDPEFVSAGEIDWRDGTLVIGLAIDGDARAYPVSHLNWREMVIDRVAGIPVLVTW